MPRTAKHRTRGAPTTPTAAVAATTTTITGVTTDRSGTGQPRHHHQYHTRHQSASIASITSSSNDSPRSSVSGEQHEEAQEDKTEIKNATSRVVNGLKTDTTEALSSSKKHIGAAAARLPEPVRFGLVVVLSLALDALGRWFVGYWTGYEVGRIEREDSKGWVEVLWRVFGLALGWFGDYDAYDLAALAVLSHGPATFLTTLFYNIRLTTSLAYLAVEALSTFLPFLLLRRLSTAHSPTPDVPNRDIVTDASIQLLTALQAGLVYSVLLFLVGRYLLPQVMVLYFQDIPTIRPFSDVTFAGWFAGATTTSGGSGYHAAAAAATVQGLCLLSGLAAVGFIFAPLVTTPARTQEDEQTDQFDPVQATLGQTVKWNLWGYTTRTKVSVRRTAVAMGFAMVGTYIDTALGIQGVEAYGAAVYAGVWAAAAVVTGLALRFVGGSV
ncbi:hypothetical protein VTJ04DRAFT_453 [Mycothermus thermophilus]|uniref:uncharacterized protein n=1 Tax=Humicola insolens TaxID=85995 RepID=UPI00374412B1